MTILKRLKRFFSLQLPTFEVYIKADAGSVVNMRFIIDNEVPDGVFEYRGRSLDFYNLTDEFFLNLREKFVLGHMAKFGSSDTDLVYCSFDTVCDLRERAGSVFFGKDLDKPYTITTFVRRQE